MSLHKCASQQGGSTGWSPAEAEFLLVAPQHRRPCLHSSFAEHVVQVYNLIFALVSDDNEQGSVPGLHAVLYESAYSTVDFLTHSDSRCLEETPRTVCLNKWCVIGALAACRLRTSAL